ncbi:MAG: hypothetical protein AAGC64_04385 [Bacteroidota bacterium]
MELIYFLILLTHISKTDLRFIKHKDVEQGIDASVIYKQEMSIAFILFSTFTRYL